MQAIRISGGEVISGVVREALFSWLEFSRKDNRSWEPPFRIRVLSGDGWLICEYEWDFKGAGHREIDRNLGSFSMPFTVEISDVHGYLFGTSIDLCFDTEEKESVGNIQIGKVGDFSEIAQGRLAKGKPQ